VDACDTAVKTFRFSPEVDVIDVLTRRANGGDPEAQFTLGLHCHDSGNQSDAFRWVLKAANGGHPMAQVNVGVCYANGEGTTADRVEAVKWLLLSAKSGCRGARQALDAIRIQLEPDEISEATRRADSWRTQSWSLDDARRYLKSTGDFHGPSRVAGVVVLVAIVLAGIAYWFFR
jgi:TPR repeat protein